jgi:hypothetical protein
MPPSIGGKRRLREYLQSTVHPEGHTHWVERGGGVNILEDARHSSVLYLYRILFDAPPPSHTHINLRVQRSSVGYSQALKVQGQGLRVARKDATPLSMVQRGSEGAE